METPLEQLEKAVAIQLADEDCNRDPYKRGLMNGMIYAVAAIKGEPPSYPE